MNAAERIFQDLLSLEINIIVKPGMTARKMPAPWYALLDIIGEFDAFLGPVAGDLNRAWSRRGSPPIRVRPPEEEGRSLSQSRRRADHEGMLSFPLRYDAVDSVVSVPTLDELRERAVETEAVHRHAVATWGFPSGDRGPILKRIYRNCDQLKGILARPEVADVLDGLSGRSDPGSQAEPATTDEVALPLTSDELVTIRKIWEVGTETVVMQTIVQLDGDLLTRVQAGRETAADQSLHELHRQAVDNAIRNWQFLGQTVASFMTSALRSFFLG